ncbi:hypothetical protein RB195_020894 [Necator americanus]|uniref:Uncharacterized protein n=1 Tax=Necator americanus TaxID=51031 RepID=A0ABR1CMN8_NECAM
MNIFERQLKSILESLIAVKRKLLMERGYEKYKSIVFKSGRNLVPSWLFFGDAPDVGSSESNTTSVTEGPNVEINNSNSDHGSFPTNETDGEVTHRVNVREESSVEENGSGLTPLTITESTTQAMDELPFSSSFSFSNPLNHSDGIPSEDSDTTKPSPSPTTMFPESSTTETENSSTMLLFTTTQATTQAATQTTTAQTSDETTQAAVQENSEESTTTGTTFTAISEISVENSTTATVPTHSSSTTAPTTTLEQISTSVEPINSSHAPEILPPLLSIPPLSDLSSFSSLNTPLDDTSRPPTPVEENSERRGVEKKKSFGVIGYRNSIRLRKLQKKFINSGKTLTHFNVAESDGRRVFRLWRNAPLSHVEKHRFVMRRARQSQKNSTHPWKRNEIYTANRRVLIVPSEKAELLTKCLHSSQKSLKHGIKKDGHPKQNGISTKIQENSRKRRSTRKLRYGYVPAKQKLLQFFIHFRPT